MRLGVLSDIHDNLWNLQPAIEFFRATCEEIICCGDLCSPFVMDQLARIEKPVHIVFGNNDADLFRITRKASDRLLLYGELAELERAGKRIAVNHFDNIALPLADSQRYDLVCYGHNHRRKISMHNTTLAVNPGPIMGAAFGPAGWENVESTFCVVDLSALEAELYQVVRGEGVRKLGS